MSRDLYDNIIRVQVQSPKLKVADRQMSVDSRLDMSAFKNKKKLLEHVESNRRLDTEPESVLPPPMINMKSARSE